MSSESEARALIGAIRPHFGLAFDCDDTLACTEKTAASVTARLVSPHLVAAGHPPLTADKVCREYSGMNFGKQLDRLQTEYSVTFPSELKDQKASGNLEALGRESRPIPGTMQLLAFVQEHQLNALVLTASDAERIRITIRCTGQDRYLTTQPDQEPSKIAVISAGDTKTWRGETIPPLPHKPEPGGYEFVARALGLKPGQMIAFEDSEPGAIAAKRAGYGRIGIVSLSARCALIPDHVQRMKTALDLGDDQRRIVVVDRSWAPAVKNALTLGLVHAKEAGVPDLPSRLPEAITAWIDSKFPAVRSISPDAPNPPVRSAGYPGRHSSPEKGLGSGGR